MYVIIAMYEGYHHHHRHLLLLVTYCSLLEVLYVHIWSAAYMHIATLHPPVYTVSKLQICDEELCEMS